VQSVANADLSFADIVVRWPGSTHDSYIFNQSSLKTKLDAGKFSNGVLLGDGGYKLETYMMTPLRNPITPEEICYNKAQILTRNVVERKYGVWKRRFPCLVFGLRCKLSTTLVVIVACAVLHNFCIKQKDQIPPRNQEVEEAIKITTIIAEGETRRINSLTQNTNKRADLKRKSYISQLYGAHN